MRARLPGHLRGAARWGAGVLALACVHTAARADDPLNSDDKPVNSDSSAADKLKKDDQRNEYNLVPVVGGSTDLGIGGGYFANYAHLRTGWDPYVWEIESAGLITFKSNDGALAVPYTDIYMKLAIPRLFGFPVRLELRPSYTKETTIDYYGLGNQNSDDTPPGQSDSYQQYGRTHPQVDLDLRFKIVDHFSGRFGGRYVRNIIQTFAGSLLVSDLQSGSPEVKDLLGVPRNSNVLLLRTGLQWDTRDNEASTYQGSLDTIDLRVSPGGSNEFPYRYGEMTLNLRWFVPIRTPYITLALRFVTSMMFGDVPFYELPHYDDTYAIGGPNGVRGIPAGRYQGKIKVLANIELRNELTTFRFLGRALVLGLTGFFDAGRVWADYSSNPQLDGTGLGIHYSIGTGLRVQSGSAFVLRADVAYSPDANPIGGYCSAGQLF